MTYNLRELQLNLKYGEGYRVISVCGQVMETCVFTEIEKRLGKIYCYKHACFEEIESITRILIKNKVKK